MPLIHQRARSLRHFLKQNGPVPAGKLSKTIPGRVMKAAEVKSAKDENGRKMFYIDQNDDLDANLEREASKKNPKSVSKVIDKIRQEV